MGRFLWYLKRAGSSLILRASIFGIFAVVTALLAYYFKGFISEDFSEKIGADAVDSLLNIIASSMLAVTTFSLSSMVSAYSAATTNVTPRSTKLLLEDKVSQTVLSTFLGAFIFSLVGIIALKIGIYGTNGRVILFVVTIGVLAAVVVFLIRWIEYLSRLGRVGETINRVEDAAKSAIRERVRNPYLGGNPYTDDFKNNGEFWEIATQNIGYVQYVDMKGLSAIAEKEGCEIALLSPPGSFSTPQKPLALIRGVEKTDGLSKRIVKNFIIGDDRSFEQDPRFGMIVLCEIASRALSPAINDPGTAIDVIGTAVRTLAIWAQEKPTSNDVQYPRLHVPPLSFRDLCEDTFMPIARDGAGIREVGLALQKAFIALSSMGRADMADACGRASDDAVARAKIAIQFPGDFDDIIAKAACVTRGLRS